jgi:hypothetical protein
VAKGRGDWVVWIVSAVIVAIAVTAFALWYVETFNGLSGPSLQAAVRIHRNSAPTTIRTTNNSPRENPRAKDAPSPWPSLRLLLARVLDE